MFKIAVFLVCAACMSPAVQGSAAGAKASTSPVETLNPAIIDLYGHQIGQPLMTPNNGPLTTLLAASLPPRTYIGQSNPVLIRNPIADYFVGESTIGMIAI